MSDRVTTTISTAPSSPPSVGPLSGRAFMVGQAVNGPHQAPVIVRSMGEFTAIFGGRTGATNLYDGAELALRSGVYGLVVQRAVGTTPVRATVSLDTGKIVVTAKNVGAYANSFTATWTVATTTLTIVAGTVTETFIGSTSALLIAAAAASAYVTVTSSGTLPGSNVATASLATGTDDFANVVWATELAKVSPDLGPGSVAIPGLAYTVVGTALLAHAAANARHAVLVAPAATAVAGLVSARTTAAAYTSAEYGDLVGPWLVVPDGAGGYKTVDPAPYLMGCRARAQRVGSGENAAAAEYAAGVLDVVAEYQVGSADWATLNAAHVSVIRTVGGLTRLYNYVTLLPTAGNPNLYAGNYRDLINSIRFDGESKLEAHANHPATASRLAQIAGELGSMLAPLSGVYLFARVGPDGALVDPGYKVEVSTGALVADSRLSAKVSLRLAEGIDFVDYTIAVGDASAIL